MKALKGIENEINGVKTQLRQQTNEIKMFIQEQKYIKIVEHLESVGHAHGDYVKGDSGAGEKLKHYYLETEKDLNHLARSIGDYFESYQGANYGRCIELSDVRFVLF